MKKFEKSREENKRSSKAREADEPLFVISIVSKMVEMHPQTIRHYERIGFIKPSRTQGKMRLYSRKDVDFLSRIAHLTRDMGVNLAGVEVILKLLEEMDEMRRRLESEMNEMRGKFNR